MSIDVNQLQDHVAPTLVRMGEDVTPLHGTKGNLSVCAPLIPLPIITIGAIAVSTRWRLRTVPGRTPLVWRIPAAKNQKEVTAWNLERVMNLLKG